MNFVVTVTIARSTACLLGVCVLSCGLLGVGGLQKPFSPRYPPLRRYPSVDPAAVSVSGFSNGAFFSVQLTFIYSSLFSAVGVFSGGPYPIAKLVTGGKFTQVLKAKATYPFIDGWAAAGAIDPTYNLRRTKAYVYTGVLDLPLAKQCNKAVVEQFSHYGASVRNRVWWTRSPHCVPTDNFPPNGDYLPIIGSWGGLCNSGYQGVNDMFAHFYGDSFVEPVSNNGTVTGNLFKYDQNEFFDDDFAEGNGFGPAAFAYVPRACEVPYGKQGRPCKLHVALHGAMVPTGARIFSDGFIEFVQLAGYLQAADANNIVVIFPECSVVNLFAYDVFAAWPTMSGPKKGRVRNGAFKNGTHPLAVRRMVGRILGEF